MYYIIVLCFLLSVVACVSLCCEVRLDDLPVIPEQVQTGPGGVQLVAVRPGMAPGAYYGPGPMAQPGQYSQHYYPAGAVGGPADQSGVVGGMGDTKMAQAYYIDANANGNAVGVGGGVGVGVGVLGPGGGGGGGQAGYATAAVPTVVAYAQPVGMGPYGPGTYAMPAQQQPPNHHQS